MAETHDYPTKTVRVQNLTKKNVIVGESGGLSAVYEVAPTMLGSVKVVTEHGELMPMAPDTLVTVYHEKRTASQIRDDLDNNISESAWELVDELVEDILDSVTLTMGADHEDVEAVVTTVRDYYGNHYTN